MSSCDYFDSPDISIEIIRKARKSHRCCECGKRIEPGDHYHYATILFDGGWDSYKTCLNCSEIQAMVIQAGGCPAMGGLAEELNDSWDDFELVYQHYFLKRVPNLISESRKREFHQGGVLCNCAKWHGVGQQSRYSIPWVNSWGRIGL